VLDVGGGPGRYTIELLKRGYQATLFDLTPELLAIAEKQIASLGLKADRIVLGDARRVDLFDYDSFDAGLLMGPLYHLSEETDRQAVLANFYRTMKPGATGIVAYLNSWGLIQTGMTDFPLKYEDAKFVHSMLDEGGIGVWYWSNPKRAQAEIERVGFKIKSYAGAEGCAGGAHKMVEHLAAANRVAYENLSQLVIETSELPPFRDLANHLHFVVSKPII
jgi:S-adenosylmethionine-dependent methyltransferase